MLLSIIIVSYNTAKLTLQTINSVLKSLEKSKNLKDKVEIILVDNNSSDKSLELIKKEIKFKNLKIIKNTANLGFSKANNLGIKKSTGEYILLLNSDTIVLNNALENLLEKARANEIDILSAALLNKDRSVQLQGGNLPNLLSLMGQFLFLDDLPLIGKYLPSTQLTGHNQKQLGKYKKQDLIYQDWVGGTAMLIDKKVFKKIGFLDEKIFMYGEDVEFCLRAKKAGLKIAIDPNSQIIHLGSQSSSSQNAILGEVKGHLYIFNKHYNKISYLLTKWVMLIGVLLRYLIFATIRPDAKKKEIYKEAAKQISQD